MNASPNFLPTLQASQMETINMPTTQPEMTQTVTLPKLQFPEMEMPK